MKYEDEPQFALNGFADEDAFADFYRQTSAVLHGYVTKVTQDPSVADDVLQIAYLRLLRAPPMDDAHRRAYLYRAATSGLGGLWRVIERERRQPQDLPSEAVCEKPHPTLGFQRFFERVHGR